jgi:hypothetical protein
MHRGSPTSDRIRNTELSALTLSKSNSRSARFRRNLTYPSRRRPFTLRGRFRFEMIRHSRLEVPVRKTA